VTAAVTRRELATAAHAAMSAVLFVTSPDVWPAFAAWAEQATPGVTWDEGHRLAMAGNAAVMARLARHVDGGDRS